MTRQEFGKIAMAIRTYYPRERILPDDYAIELWYDALKDLDYQATRFAIKKWAETSRWSPSISDIRGMCATMVHGEFNTWEEEWQKVLLTIHRYGYSREQEAMETLSEVTRKIVTRLGYKNLCLSENPAVDRANFRDAYNSLVNKQKDREKMSQPIRQTLDASTAKRYTIPEKKTEAIESKVKEEVSKGTNELSNTVQEGLKKLRGELFGER